MISPNFIVAIAALTAGLASEPAPSSSPLAAIDGPMLDKMCRAQGSLGGEFYVVEQPDESQPKDIGGFPRWELDEPVGPFIRYSRWSFAPSHRVHTIRYYGRKTPGMGIFEYYEHISPIAEEGGWSEIEDYEFGAVVSWQKQVITSNGPITLQLSIDGGMLSNSIYCVHRTLYDEAVAELAPPAQGQD